MYLTKLDLEEMFESAQQQNAEFVFVEIEAEGVYEIICIPQRSLEEKLKYYEQAYTYELTHVMNKEVSIKGISYGGSKKLEDIK